MRCLNLPGSYHCSAYFVYGLVPFFWPHKQAHFLWFVDPLASKEHSQAFKEFGSL
jgi:hypothetical protein